MVIGFTNLGFCVIKCFGIRHRGRVCIRVRFGLGLFFLVLRITVVELLFLHRSSLGRLDDPCMDSVGLCHSKDLILLMPFPQPPHQRVHG